MTFNLLLVPLPGIILKLKCFCFFKFVSGEWISGAVCMFIAKSLVEDYSVSTEVTNFLNNLEIVLVPFVNPDGYVVSLGLCIFTSYYMEKKLIPYNICMHLKHVHCYLKMMERECHF